MLNEREQKAKAEETGKMQGEAEGEMRRGIGSNAG